MYIFLLPIYAYLYYLILYIMAINHIRIVNGSQASMANLLVDVNTDLTTLIAANLPGTINAHSVSASMTLKSDGTIPGFNVSVSCQYVG